MHENWECDLNGIHFGLFWCINHLQCAPAKMLHINILFHTKADCTMCSAFVYVHIMHATAQALVFHLDHCTLPRFTIQCQKKIFLNKDLWRRTTIESSNGSSSTWHLRANDAALFFNSKLGFAMQMGWLQCIYLASTCIVMRISSCLRVGLLWWWHGCFFVEIQKDNIRPTLSMTR